MLVAARFVGDARDRLRTPRFGGQVRGTPGSPVAAAKAAYNEGETMRLKLGVLLGVLVLGAAAVVAVATPSADAKRGDSHAFPITGTGTGGEAVDGMLTITNFKVVNGVLTAFGTFDGTVNGAAKTGTASAPVKTINSTTLGSAPGGLAAQAAATCDILDLTLGPLHLDLLGLIVDLNQVHLQITAEQGQGNLLGNLLCAVAGLLDNNPVGGGGGAGGLGGLLQTIANLLNQILGSLQL